MTGIAYAQGAATSPAGGLASLLPLFILNSCIAAWILIDSKKRNLNAGKYYALAACIFGLFVIPVYFIYTFRKNNVMTGQIKTHICTNCYEVNKPINMIGGSSMIELVLFFTVLFSLLFLPLLIITLPVFLIYNHNRHRGGKKKNYCPICKTQTMVPIDSRRGQMLISEQDRSLPQAKQEPGRKQSSKVVINSGELITEIAGGANLVEGKYTWEYAEEKKHDIVYMKKCCEAELRTMEKAGLVPAPYYFQRVAILSRKERNYQQEIYYCEIYINTVENFYRKKGTEGVADVRNGPTYKAIVKRLPRAKELQDKHSPRAKAKPRPKKPQEQVKKIGLQ